MSCNNIENLSRKHLCTPKNSMVEKDIESSSIVRRSSWNEENIADGQRPSVQKLKNLFAETSVAMGKSLDNDDWPILESPSLVNKRKSVTSRIKLAFKNRKTARKNVYHVKSVIKN